MELFKVITLTLKFIGEQAIQKLREQVGKVVATKLKWVLTVPALWSE
jgi:hypothetical protein